MPARSLGGIGALLFAIASPLSAQEDNRTITASIANHPGGDRALTHEAIIDAPPARVWEAFTTVEGWKSWGVVFAELDIREGGLIETSYFADAGTGDPRNIHHRILAMIPQRMMVTRIEQAPPDGPVNPAIFERMWNVYELEPLEGDRTRLRITGHGYATGERFDRVLAFFELGNVAAIERMRSVMETTINGPKGEEEGE
ncbi:MAG: SRPBCC family protein [Erythrobacter sp.]